MENKDDIGEFLKKMAQDSQETSQWDKVIQRNSSYLIVGDVGTGKSALAYYLLETFGKRYGLTPAVVGFPKNKQHLLPSDWIVLDGPDECTKCENVIVFIDEADIQLPMEDTKARQYVVNFLSLPRHRKQIFFLAFHFPRLVLGRYLPFFSAFLLKRPPYLLEFASKSKGDTMYQMMEKAEERFAEFTTDEQVHKNTYVVAPRIRWQGMLDNPLCSFWNEGLSEVWAGTDVEPKKQLEPQPEPQKQLSLVAEAERILAINRQIMGWRADDPEMKANMSVSGDMMKRATVAEEHRFENSGYDIMEAENELGVAIQWVKQIY